MFFCSQVSAFLLIFFASKFFIFSCNFHIKISYIAWTFRFYWFLLPSNCFFFFKFLFSFKGAIFLFLQLLTMTPLKFFFLQVLQIILRVQLGFELFCEIEKFDGRILGSWLEVDVKDFKKQHHFTSTLHMLQFWLDDEHGHGCLGQNMKYNMVLAFFHDLVW